ncbi:hypothetical protein PUN28_006165 [Cardiocondyla obscurior]|uniref:Uncharacterized protein n=1 Tax=Cardiocondyla obscurior TaxID=286306 RepID=A0AAW2G7G1_9HYME
MATQHTAPQRFAPPPLGGHKGPQEEGTHHAGHSKQQLSGQYNQPVDVAATTRALVATELTVRKACREEKPAEKGSAEKKPAAEIPARTISGPPVKRPTAAEKPVILRLQSIQPPIKVRPLDQGISFRKWVLTLYRPFTYRERTEEVHQHGGNTNGATAFWFL